MVANKIRVMVVDDSLFFREFMCRSLAEDPSIEVVGVAGDAYEAKQKIARIRPDVITLDMEMPKARGTEILRHIRLHYPDVHAVVISSNPHHVLEALHAGAVEFVPKPNSQSNMDKNTFIKEAISKIKITAVSSFTSRVLPSGGPTGEANPQSLDPPAAPATVDTPPFSSNAEIVHVRPPMEKPKMPAPVSVQVGGKGIIAIGASTGGTEAILTVLKDLPKNMPGIVIVQHMPPVFTKMYAQRLDENCKIRVKEAQTGDKVEPGVALLAPGNLQMQVCGNAGGYFVRCEPGDKVSGHCPSVDVLFESVTQRAGSSTVGVLLTGMGSDGARGLLAMRKAGAYTIGQDRSTCVVYGMPMVAHNLGAVVDQLPLEAIPGALVRHFFKG